jgi:flagellar basal-body rod modification protein FlgD
MAAVSGVTQDGTTQASQAAPAPVAGKTLGMNDFLKLLVTQLQNQDPLNPLDQNQFLSQTAQFTSVEQLQQINQALADLKTSSSSSGMTQAASLIGKTVTVAGQDFPYDGSNPPVLPFTVQGAAGQVQVQILDGQGNLVRTLNVAAGSSGDYGARWNGQDSSGRPITPGTYHYRVGIVPGSGSPDASAAVGQGLLTGFDMRNGTLRYQVGGALVRPDDVTAVQQ